MKKTALILFLIAMGVLFIASTASEKKAERPLRIAVVDMNTIVLKSETIRERSAEEEKLIDEKQKQLQEKGDRYKEMRETYDRQESILNENEKQKRQKEIQQLELDIKDFQDDIRMSVRNLRTLEQKYLRRIQSIVENIAREREYDMVLMAEVALYVSDTLDITDDVAKEIDKQQEEEKKASE